MVNLLYLCMCPLIMVNVVYTLTVFMCAYTNYYEYGIHRHCNYVCVHFIMVNMVYTLTEIMSVCTLF